GAVFQIPRAPTHGVVGPWEHVALLAGADVEPREIAVAAGEHDVRIIGARRDPAALAAVDVVPVLLADAPAARDAARDAHSAGVQHVDGLGVFGIGVNVRVVPGALAQIALVVGAPPRLAAVLGAEDAARVRFDDRPHAIVIRRDGHADLADRAFRKAVIVREL